MPRALLRLLVLLPLAGCEPYSDTIAPAPPERTDAEPALAALATRADWLPELTVPRAGPAPQQLTIELSHAALPGERFMGPYDLVVRELPGSDVRGTIRLDTTIVVRLNALAPGETLRRRIVPEVDSRLVLSLGGAEGGAIAIRIEAAIQPAPAISMRTARGAMLLGGDYDTSTVIVSGRACHATSPIEVLTVNGIAIALAGTRPCEAFSVPLSSDWGMTTIDVTAVNANGRAARRVQSFLRGPHYFAPALAISPGMAYDTTTDVGLGILARFEQPGHVKLLSPLPQWMNGAAALVADMPDTLVDRHTNTPCVITRGFRTWLVRTGVPTASIAPGFAYNIAGQQSLVVRPAYAISVPLTMYVTTRSNCGPGVTSTRTGSLSSTVRGIFPLSVGVDPGGDGVETGAQYSGIEVAAYALNLDLSGMTVSQQEQVRVDIRAAHDARIEANMVAALPFAIHATLPFEQLDLETSRLASVGVALQHAAGAFRFFNSNVDTWFRMQAAPLTVQSPIAPLRGALRAPITYPLVQSGADYAQYVADDVTNQVLWAAWQGGHFDASDLAAAVPLEGIAVEVHPWLPPVVTQGAAGRVRVGLGDIELAGTVDPGIYGLRPGVSGAAVEVRAFASVSSSGFIRYDAELGRLRLTNLQPTVVVEFISPSDALLDEEAVAEALRQAVRTLFVRRMAAAIGALPLPVADLSGYAGLPAGTEIDLVDPVSARFPDYHVLVTGSIGAF